MLVIFDWDGTLADSQEHIVRSMQAAITQLALPPQSNQACANMIGLGLLEVARTLFPQLDEHGRGQFAEVYSFHFTQLRQEYGGTQFFPGAIETLRSLKQRGHSLAIATGKSRRGLNRVLDADAIGDLFVSTKAADETASKPNPLMLEAILSETGAQASEAVMVGDTSYDLEMALRLQMPSVAVSYGVHDVADLKQYSPALIIDAMDELLHWPVLS